MFAQIRWFFAHRQPALLAASMALCACGGGGSTALLTTISGTYEGSFRDATASTLPLTLTLTQSGTSLLGTWSGGLTNTPNSYEYGNGGDIVGTVIGSSVSLDLMPEVYTQFGYSLTGTVNGATISGNFTIINTSGGGSFTATKT
jgi:hypothetical protein